jgi:5S rRNA maturation endonuclease (ribonuclease M5)
MATKDRSKSVPSGQARRKFNDEDINKAKGKLSLAFALLGLYKDGVKVCPSCGADKPKKVVFKSSKTGQDYWKCYPCGNFSDAIKLLKDFGGMEFYDAIGALLELDGFSKPDALVPVEKAEKSFSAVVDVEVYDFIRDFGDIEAAVNYWSTWHIDGEVVRQSGSTVITDANSLHRELVNFFGWDRLIAAGVVIVIDEKDKYFLINAEYPVIEVHESPSGHVVGMQFRPSLKQREKVLAHKRWKERWSKESRDGVSAADAWKVAYNKDPIAAGERSGYVTPFLSIKGAGVDSLVGCGIHRMHTLPAGSKIYIVEGFKDMLAARSMGVEAYAIPGTGVMPSKKVCAMLSRFDVIVVLDGDAAGAKGRENLMAHLTANNVKARVMSDIREDLDIADLLVERYAHQGCDCATCLEFIKTRAFDSNTCVCNSCKAKRSADKN